MDMDESFRRWLVGVVFLGGWMGGWLVQGFCGWMVAG